jgi:hypothetical protein
MAKGLGYFRDSDGNHFLGGRLIDPQLAAMAERVSDLTSMESIAQIEALQLGCTRCQEKQHCHDWLDSSDGTDYRKFCNNTAILDRLWVRGAIKSDALSAASFRTDVQSESESPSEGECVLLLLASGRLSAQPEE